MHCIDMTGYHQILQIFALFSSFFYGRKAGLLLVIDIVSINFGEGRFQGQCLMSDDRIFASGSI